MLCFQSCGLRSSVPLGFNAHPSIPRTPSSSPHHASCSWRQLHLLLKRFLAGKGMEYIDPVPNQRSGRRRQGAHRRRAHHPQQQPGPLAHTPDAHLPGGRPAMPARAHLPPLAAAAVAEPIVFASVSIATSSSLCWQGARQVPLARSAQGLSGRG